MENTKKKSFVLHFDDIREWNNGCYGAIGYRDGDIVYIRCSWGDDCKTFYEKDKIIIATGFTAYQFVHPDDVDSMRQYYDQCKERYKASRKYAASFNDKKFIAEHIKDETDKADISKQLYVYLNDNELKELVDRYLEWLHAKQILESGNISIDNETE